MIRGDVSIVGKRVLTQSKKRLEYMPGYVLVRIQEKAVRSELGPTPLALSAAEAKRLPAAVSEPLDYLRRNAGLKAVRPLFSRQRARIERAPVSSADRQRLAMLSSVSDSESEELGGVALLSVDPKKVTPKLIRHLKASKGVQLAEPVPARWIANASADPMQNVPG
jgi:hypothetical protein